VLGDLELLQEESEPRHSKTKAHQGKTGFSASQSVLRVHSCR
jgi:hypothetical protein